MTFQEDQHRAPTLQSVTVRKPRKHLLPGEVEKLLTAAKGNRHGHRDYTAILLAYRHGLRSVELVGLQWADVDLSASRVHVRRAKGSEDSTHPLEATELRALRKLQRDTGTSPYLFVNERGSPWDTAGYQRMVARTAKKAGFPFPVSSHALRHACGYKLANDGRDTRALAHYLGHRNLNNTERYTKLAANRFDGWWR